MHMDEIRLLQTLHTVADTDSGADDAEYRISFSVDCAFRKAKSHAAEVMMLCTYAPDAEYGTEGDSPYLAVQCDDAVYEAVESYKETGSFDGASELTPLSGQFLFKAKMEYFGEMMYFYALDRCGGFWENNALCMVYPKEYAGTENEQRLMRVLDAAAASYREERIGSSPAPHSQASAPVSQQPAKRDVLQTVTQTAKKINRLRFWARLAVLVGLIAVIIGGRIAKRFRTQHLIALNGSETVLSDFTPDEQQQILDAFHITVPAQEQDACVSAFLRSNRNEKMCSYVIEIGGVSDYDAFFAANAARDLGHSVNETRVPDPKKQYYITYNVYFVQDPGQRAKHENAAAYDRIEALFAALSA